MSIISIKQRYLVLSLIIIIISATVIFSHLFSASSSDYTNLYNTYNPTTFGKLDSSKLQKSAENNKQEEKDSQTFQKIDNLFQDENLQRRINRDLNNRCPVFTFFNDQKIRKLTQEEQQYHRTLLRKWVMLYNSLGFRPNILHYNDAISNEKLTQFSKQNLLFKRPNQMNENYMKLLAWEYKLETSKVFDGFKSSFYSDYTLFPMVSRNSLLEDIRHGCGSPSNFTIIRDYEFQLIISDKESITQVLETIIQKRTDFDIQETDKFNNIFADYSIATFQKIMHSNNIKLITQEIPKILDQHLRSYRLSNRFERIRLIDPLSLPGHYFIKPLTKFMGYLATAPQFLYPPPTKDIVVKFEREFSSVPMKRISHQSAKEDINKVNNMIEQFIRSSPTLSQKGKSTEDIEVVVTSEFTLTESNSRTLTLVSIPHPISVISALQMNDLTVMNGDDISSFPNHDFLVQNVLKKNFKNIEDVEVFVKNKDLNHVFFNAEMMEEDSIFRELSIVLGFDIRNTPHVLDTKFEVKYNSQPLNKILGEKLIISETDRNRKMDRIKSLIIHHEESPKLRKFDTQLLQTKDDLKKLDVNSRAYQENLFKILVSQEFEQRHDPVVEISETYNPKDSNFWHLVQNVRFIDDVEFNDLSNI